MNSDEQIFAKYQDESGKEYYCTINSVADNNIVSEWELDNCVEVATAERYSGHLKIVT